MTPEKIATLCQKCSQGNPVVVLGSGASIPHGIKGMTDLSQWLIQTVVPDDGEETSAWALVKAALQRGNHLEQALEDNSLPTSLVSKVVRRTWDSIAADDYALFTSSIRGEVTFALGKLFAGLFQSTARNIDVITTNYDRVVEYAADTEGYIHRNGFLPGYLRRAEGADSLTFRQGNNRARTVTVWKVHGSLDWFSNHTGEVLSLPLSSDLPDGLTPLIVTPGVSKYQRTHDEPFRTAIHGADRVLTSAGAIICLGYGFRDTHIHPKLVTRCRVHDVPILVAARRLTQEARNFINLNGGSRYVALEDHEEGTMVYCSDSPDGYLIEGEKYWELSELNKICGF